MTCMMYVSLNYYLMVFKNLWNLMISDVSEIYKYSPKLAWFIPTRIKGCEYSARCCCMDEKSNKKARAQVENWYFGRTAIMLCLFVNKSLKVPYHIYAHYQHFQFNLRIREYLRLPNTALQTVVYVKRLRDEHCTQIYRFSNLVDQNSDILYPFYLCTSKAFNYA